MRLTAKDVERRRAIDKYMAWQSQWVLVWAAITSPLVIPFLIWGVVAEGGSPLYVVLVSFATVTASVIGWRARSRMEPEPPRPTPRWKE